MIIICLLCAFRSGTDRYYYNKSQGLKVGGRDILFYLRWKNILPLLCFYVNYWLRKLLLVFLCFLPAVLSFLALFVQLEKNDASLKVSMVLFFGGIILLCNGLFFFIRLNSFLFLSRYYFVSDKYSGFRELFDFSYRKIAKERGRVLRKRLGFIGWFLSCLLVFPAVFVRCYYRESMAALARDIIDN